MMKGMKSALEYCSTQFSPYQHRQMRIVEFPRILGSFAQSFPNTVPFSEGVGFIADVDDSTKVGNDYHFYITAHEVAHQWFAHQVIGADVLGATVMSESLSEYVALKIIERVNGKNKMRKYPSYKKQIDHSCRQMAQLIMPCRVINIRPGWTATDRIHKDFHKQAMSSNSIALAIRRITELPNDVRPTEVTLLPELYHGRDNNEDTRIQDKTIH